MNSKLSVIALIVGFIACAGVSWNAYQQTQIMSMLDKNEKKSTTIADDKPIVNDNNIFKLANSKNKNSSDSQQKETTNDIKTTAVPPSEHDVNLNENDSVILIKQKLLPQLVDLFALTKPNEQIKIVSFAYLYLVEINANSQKVSFFTNQDASLLIPVRSVLKMNDGLGLIKKSINSQAERAGGSLQSNATSSTFDDKPSLTEDQLAANEFVSNISDKALYEKLASTAIEYPAFGSKVGEFVVFFDPECGFCREFYPKIKKLQAAGFTVRLALLPLARTGSTQTSLLYALCDKDPKAKIDDMVHKKPIFVQDANCVNPIPDTINISKQIKFKGTPWVMLPDGRSGDIRILRTYINAVAPDNKQESSPKMNESGGNGSNEGFDSVDARSESINKTASDLNTTNSSSEFLTPSKNTLLLESDSADKREISNQ